MTKTSKLSQAMEAYKTGNYKTNAEFVQYLMTDLSMSKLGARTYAYNIKQKLGRWAVDADKIKADVVETAPKVRKHKVVKPSKIAVSLDEVFSIAKGQSSLPSEVDDTDPLAIPDFLQRPRTKAEGEMEPRKPRRKAKPKSVIKTEADTQNALTNSNV